MLRTISESGQFTFRPLLVLFLAAVVSFADARVAIACMDDEGVDEDALFFTEKVLPLLESRCFECHGDGEDLEGQLNLTSRRGMLEGGESGEAIIPGDADASNLISAVRYESFEMPPRNKLPDEEIEILVKWVNSGAKWPGEDEQAAVRSRPMAVFPIEERRESHWAWRSIRRPEPPQVQQQDWPASELDRFLLSRLEAAGLSPAADASRRSVLRRMHLDLTGLPPSPALQDRVFRDPRSDREVYAELADELLAAPEFGERWGRHWLDLVRYAETLGHEFDYPLPHAWKYRDYVIRALNADVPYDQFVREHLAGDLLADPRTNPENGINESIIATGFWYLCEDKHAPVDVRLEEALRIDNQLDVFGKTFLGLTIACARCHDHKFDAISTADYYALSGFLQSSRRRIEWLDPGNRQRDRAAAIDLQRIALAESAAAGLAKLAPQELAAKMLRVLSNDNLTAEEQKIRDVLLKPEVAAVAHPLSLLARLAAGGEASDVERLQKWKDEVNAAAPRERVSVEEGENSPRLFADLRQGVPEGWFTFGLAFESQESRGDTVRQNRPSAAVPAVLPKSETVSMLWTPDGPVSDLAAVTSAARGPNFRGALHSPEWTLDRPEVLILAAGKNARVRLVIDGYVMNEFSQLLFSGIKQKIDTNGEYQWIRLGGDLRRYMGHRCHLEFLDEGDGWFAVREVRLISGGGVPVPPEVSRTALSVDALQDREAAVRDWASAVVRDPAWISAAASCGLPESAAQRFAEGSAEWMKLAAEPSGGDPVLVMCDGTGEDERVFIRGNHRNLGQVAQRRLMTALDRGQPLRDSSASGRLELAERVLSEDNPFPARVVVNRVWMHLFGRGIVATPENFGVLGESPTHPELLDYLADEFRRDGWSMKRLIRRMVLSRAYAMSSKPQAEATEKDPNNLLLHHANIRRVEGEVLRDTVLAISGRLDKRQFGPPTPVHLTEFMQGRGRPGQSGPVDGAGRRSIYLSVNRNFLSPFMLTFDMPQPASAVARRSQSNVPAQALILLNNAFMHEQAQVWADRLLKETQTADEVLNLAWRLAFSRLPDEGERAAVKEYAASLPAAGDGGAERALRDRTALKDICHALLNKKELLFLD